MSDFKQKPMKGSLFRNDKKQTDTQPDYRGDCCIEVNGQEVDMWLSAWINEGQRGKYMSLSFQPKDEQPSGSPHKVYQQSESKPEFADLEDDFNSGRPF